MQIDTQEVKSIVERLKKVTVTDLTDNALIDKSMALAYDSITRAICQYEEREGIKIAKERGER